MCGIVGYTGRRVAADVILSGLKRLEYRGYDSAGMAWAGEGELGLVKRAGRIVKLESALMQRADGMPSGSLAIGHTRWATHGLPDERNAHPHLSRNGCFAIVHNGIIDNYAALKSHLTARGYVFMSDTDSEVIAHLIEDCYSGDLRAATSEALERLDGTYGIAVISSLHPGQIVAARKGSPIVIGVCRDETIIASDASAIISHTDQVIFLDDGDVVLADPDTLDITSRRNVPVTRAPIRIDWEPDAIEKGGYAHFMLKEIFEQPDSLANTVRGRLIPEDGTTKLSGMQMDSRALARIDRIVIAACGTSFYAGMVGKHHFEEIAGIPTDVQQAAEFRDRNPFIGPDNAMIAISQSGETADTLGAVREAARKGSCVLGICNVVGSTIAREVGRGVYLHAGPEIGVASTKAFTCQVAVLAMMAVLMGRTRRLSRHAGAAMCQALAELPALCRRVLEQDEAIRSLAERFAHHDDFFYIGRGYGFPAAMEGALKLKEISYIHAEGYHAAELKHGPIALLDASLPVVAVVPAVPGREKTIANMQECRARKAPVLAIATEHDDAIADHCDAAIRIPACEEFLVPIPAVIAMQLFAYHVARVRGCEIDQPRNLAKSVTVE